ncbi:MAG: hypothetical protein ABIE74_12450 [Pseudomonadota bacterium]
MTKSKKNIKLPKSFAKYFWDCEFKDLQFEKYKFFIIERILNFGDVKAVRWLLENTGVRSIKIVVRRSREIDERTKNFWYTIWKM